MEGECAKLYRRPRLPGFVFPNFPSWFATIDHHVRSLREAAQNKNKQTKNNENPQEQQRRRIKAVDTAALTLISPDFVLITFDIATMLSSSALMPEGLWVRRRVSMDSEQNEPFSFAIELVIMTYKGGATSLI